MTHARLLFLLVAAVAVAACDEGGPNISGVDPISIQRIELEPAIDTAYVGDTIAVADSRPYTATAIGRTGAPLQPLRYVWESSVPEVATVDDDGMVRPVGLGTTTITASAGKQAEAVLVVLQQVAAVSIAPASPTGAEGTTLPLTGVALGPDGAPVRGVAFTWTTSNPAVATVDEAGVATLLSAGTTMITVTGGGVTGQAQLVVVDGE